MLVNADIRENFAVEVLNPKKQKQAKEAFNKKLKTWNETLR